MTDTPFIALGSMRIALILATGLLTSCGENESPDDKLAAINPPEIATIVPAREALAGAYIPKIDPAPMNDAEIEKALGAGPHCVFKYTGDGKPVLAVTKPGSADARGTVKLNGNLVLLKGAAAEGKLMLNAKNVRITLSPYGPLDAPRGIRQEADLVFEIGEKLRAGYGGYYVCPSEPLPSGNGG